MTRRRHWATLLSLALATAPAAAQGPSPSHVPIPRTPDSDPVKLFAQRIKQSQLRSDVEGLLKQFGSGTNPFALKGQLEKLLADHPEIKNYMPLARGYLEGKNLNDPKVLKDLQQTLQAFLKNNSGLGLNELAPTVTQRQSPNRTHTKAPDPPRSADSPPRPQEEQRPPDAAPNGRPREQRPLDPAEQAARRAWVQSIAEWAERFPRDKLAGPLRDSPALRNLLRDLSQAGRGAFGGATGEGLEAQLARWEGRFNALRDWLPRDWADELGSRMPSLANLPRPDFNLPSFDWSPPSLPSAPAVGPPQVDLAALGQFVLLVFAILAGAAVLWRLRAARLAPAGAGRRWRGPWPLDPNRVATRAELIQAFEYLSLARCGDAARTWHHRAIAERLGGTEEERQAAATRLAALYEQARYAPADLPEPDWTAARRPLTFLAGSA